MDLVKTLNRLGKEVMQKYPDINRGGCCVYAAIVAAELHKKGIEARGIAASYMAKNSPMTIDEARKNVKGNTLGAWNTNGIFFCHVGIEFDYLGRTHHYDTNGVKMAKGKFDGMPIYKGRLTRDELKALARNQDGWNIRFNRKDIPSIRKLVRSHFKDMTT